MAKKPSAAVIVASAPLSTKPWHDPLIQCNVCGAETDSLTAWCTHDERDQPIEGNEALVFIGRDHPGCIKIMENHPRLFTEERGEPGHFPKLCGGCRNRVGLECVHPKLKSRGGPGLLVQISDPLRGAIVCGSRGRINVVKHAFACEGQTLPGEPKI